MKLLTLLLASVMSCCHIVALDRDRNDITPTDRQISELKKAGIPTVLPEYLPPGFRAMGFQSTTYSVDWSEDKIAGDYVASYKNQNNCEVRIRGADWGWKAPNFTDLAIVDTELFGKVALKQNSLTTKSSGSIAPILSAVSDTGKRMGPLESSGFPEAEYILNFDCANSSFDDREAIKILQSLEIQDF